MLQLGTRLALLAPTALHFLGDQTCPDRASTEAQLREIDPDALDSKARHFALLEPQPNGLRVRLFDDEGHLLEERLLDGSKSCAEWAKISAALLATWEIDLAAPDFEPARRVLTAAAASPSPITTSQGVRVAARPGALQAEVGLGLGPTAGLTGDASSALGGELMLGLSSRAYLFGGQLVFSGSTARSLSVGGGTAEWQRFALSLGGHGTFTRGDFRLELGAAFLASLLSASGRGFLVASSATAINPGLGVSSRLGWQLTRNWLAWLQGGTSLWLNSEILAGSTAVSAAQIPSIDLFATLGLSFTFDL